MKGNSKWIKATTICKLIKRFEKLNPDYEAYLEHYYRGFYAITIESNVHHIANTYTFSSCKEFKEWIDGVVLD